MNIKYNIFWTSREEEIRISNRLGEDFDEDFCKKGKMFDFITDLLDNFSHLYKEFNEDVMVFNEFSTIPEKLQKLLLKYNFITYVDYNDILTELMQSIISQIKKGISENDTDDITCALKQYNKVGLYSLNSDDISILSEFIKKYELSPNMFFKKLFESVSEDARTDLFKYLSSFSYCPKTFEQFQHVLQYIEEMKENRNLQTPDMFLFFVNNYLGIKLNQFYNERLFYDKLEPYENPADFLGCEDINDCYDNAKYIAIHNAGVLYANNIIEFIYSSVYFILKQGMVIKRCENCDKHFVPYERTDTKYCEKISPQDSTMTCQEYGTRRLWYKNGADYYKLYRRVYKRKQMNAIRNPDVTEYQEEFERFKTQSSKWRKDVKAGVKSEQEFIVWLNEQ